jgi:hypothetical protein
MAAVQSDGTLERLGGSPGETKMGDQASGPNQIIELPKGGGAQRGLGEKFSPDLHTGTGNFTVPIAIPPGRNGFQPRLNLAYSTGNGNAPGPTRKICRALQRSGQGSSFDCKALP